MIPKAVSCYVQYRDAGNWKSGDTYYWTNDREYTEEYLQEVLSKLGYDPVIPAYYSLPEIAPVTNEFLPSHGDDHSYVEADDWEFYEEMPKTNYPIDYYGDIEEVVYPLTNPEELKRRVDLAKAEAKKILQDHLNAL